MLSVLLFLGMVVHGGSLMSETTHEQDLVSHRVLPSCPRKSRPTIPTEAQGLVPEKGPVFTQDGTMKDFFLGIVTNGTGWQYLVDAGDPNPPVHAQTKNPKHVVIVGAGVAGLAAAFQLTEAGHSVEIVEAQNRIGGRMMTVSEPFADGLHAEVGAMRLPGQNPDDPTGHFLTNYYAKLFQIPYVEFKNDDPNTFYLMYDNVIRMADWTPNDTLRMWPNWDADLNMNISREERAALGITDISGYWGATIKYAKDELISAPDADGWARWVEKWSKLSGYEFLHSQIYQEPSHPRLRPWSKEAIAAFSTLSYFPLMNMDMVEILRDDLGKWWESPMYQFKEGMRALPESFVQVWKNRGSPAKKLELAKNIRYGTEVVGIHQATDGSGVTIHTRNVASRQRQRLKADAVILTPTLPIIRQIDFEPALSNEKQDALNDIFYEASVKVLLQTKTRFWEKHGIHGGWSKSSSILGQLHYSLAANNTARGLLVCYTWAQNAKILMALPPDERIRHVIAEVAKLHPEIESEFEVGATHSWLDDRWTQGGWVLFRPFHYLNWFNAACAPEGSIYFAGEASSWSNGWIQGALESSTRATYQFYEDNENGFIHSSVLQKPEMIVVVEQNAGSVALYERDGELIARLNLCLWPHEVEIFPDQRTAVVSCFGLQDYDESIGYPGHSVVVIDLETQTERERLFTTTDKYNYGAPHGVKLRPHTEELFVNVEYPDDRPTIVVFDVSHLLDDKAKRDAPSSRKRGVLRSFPLPCSTNELGFDKTFNATSKTHNLLFDASGTNLFLQTAYGLIKMDPASGAERGRYNVPFPGIHGAAWAGPNILVSSVNRMDLIDPHTMKSVRAYENLGVGQLLYSIATPDQKWILAVAVWDSQLLIVDAATGLVKYRVFAGTDPVHVAASRDSSHCFVASARSSAVIRIDIYSGMSTVLSTGAASGPNGIALADRRPKFKKGSLQLGAAIQLSGADGSSGREFLLGLELWKDSVNGKGGIFVEGVDGKRQAYLVDIDFEDVQSNIALVYERTLKVAHRGAKFLFGPYGTDANVEAAKAAKSLAIPLLTPGGAGSSVYSAGGGYVFGILPPASGYLTPVVDILSQQAFPKPASFVLLGIDDAGAFEDAVATAEHAVSKGLKNQGNELHLPNPFSFERGVIKFKTGETNFDALVQLLASSPPSLILVASHVAEAIAITTALNKHNVNPLALAFSVGPSLPSFATQVPNALYIMGASPWIQSDTTPGLDRWGSPALFELAYENRYHTRASYLSAGAATCGILLEMAIAEARSIDTEAVKTALRTIDTTTSYGRIKIGPNGNNIAGRIHPMQVFPAPISNLVTGTGTIQRDISTTPVVYPFPGWSTSLSTASIRGFYWFTKHGGSPFADFVGTMEFSGDGTFRGNFTIISRAPPQELTYDGTYYFNASGLGKFTWVRATGLELHSHIIGVKSIANSITQLYSSFDQPDDGQLQGRMIYKIPTATLAFSNASMNGTYFVAKAGGEPFMDFLGLMSFDGNGTYWGFYSSTNQNGTILPQTNFNGHYAILLDGTGRFVWSGGSSRIVATSSNEFEILTVYSAFVEPLGKDGSIQSRWLSKRDNTLLPQRQCFA